MEETMNMLFSFRIVVKLKCNVFFFRIRILHLEFAGKRAPERYRKGIAQMLQSLVYLEVMLCTLGLIILVVVEILS